MPEASSQSQEQPSPHVALAVTDVALRLSVIFARLAMNSCLSSGTSSHEDRVGRADRHTGAAIDAAIRIHVKLGGRLESTLVFWGECNRWGKLPHTIHLLQVSVITYAMITISHLCLMPRCRLAQVSA